MAGYRALFSGLCINVDAGQWLRLTGPNGTGKTTLLRALAGLIRPTWGDVFWKGSPVDTSASAWHANIHYLGHRPAIKDSLSARENLQIWLSLDHTESPATADINQWLTHCGLQHREDLTANRLSAGQRKRLQLARLMAAPQKLWLLDEPTNALDDAGSKLFCQMLDTHLANGGCAIVATHEPIAVDTPARAFDMRDAAPSGNA